MAAVIKSGKGLAVKLPGYIVDSLSLKEGDKLEFGMVDKTTASMKKLERTGKPDIEVMRRLNSIKFSERTKEAVDKLLSEEEKKILEKLIKKKIVSFYNKGKYADNGVYSISRDYYYLLTQRDKPEGLKKDFIVVDDMNKAMELMEEFKPKIRDGEILTVRSFNKKFYFVNSEMVDTLGSELFAQLGQKDTTVEELAKKTGKHEELVRAVLEILRESGDVIEKKKGLYSLA